jgi:hypothetical protein
MGLIFLRHAYNRFLTVKGRRRGQSAHARQQETVFYLRNTSPGKRHLLWSRLIPGIR